jgi:hypothetical protein
MKAEGLLTHSQEPVIRPYSEPVQSTYKSSKDRKHDMGFECILRL